MFYMGERVSGLKDCMKGEVYIVHKTVKLPSSACRHILTHLQQTNFENIVAKGEIAQNEQFHHLPLCFQLFSVPILSFIECCHVFAWLFTKSSAADLFYVGKG